MLFRLKFLYYVRKPRILSENDLSLKEYRKSLRDARRNVHIEAKEYQEKIQNQYLEQHKQQMRQRHFRNQCNFRKKIFTQAFRLYQHQKVWQRTDQIFTSRQNKYLHDEDVRKINRSRIIKIMEHESSNYWYNSENVDERLTEQMIFPEYIASTEYYYKLFGESLAYEQANLDEVHEISSNEQAMKQKNKLLIPIFIKLKTQISRFKEKYSNRNNHLIANQKSQLKTKITNLIAILQIWKEYTNILGMTSAQLREKKIDDQHEGSINKLEKDLLKNMVKKESEVFIGSVEEDTEELSLSFQEYLNSIQKDVQKVDSHLGKSSEVEQLQFYFDPADKTSGEVTEGNINLNNLKGLGLGDLLSSQQSKLGKQIQSQQFQKIAIRSEFLNPRETTSSIQILKQQIEDEELIDLLNKLGQIDVRYPLLFEKIWNQETR